MENIDESKLSPPIGFLFTNKEIEIIVNYLVKHPWMEVNDIIQMIISKIQKNIQK